MKDKRSIYFIIIQLVVFLFLTYIIVVNYTNLRFNNLNKPYITMYLKEIKTSELDEYLSEDTNAIMYICNYKSKNCRDFEKQLVPIIKKYELEDKIIYINYTDNNDFLARYNLHTSSNVPLLVQFKNKIVSYTYEYKNDLSVLEDYFENSLGDSND